MSPGIKYTFARVGLFLACAIPASLLLPNAVDELIKLLIALAVSSGLSFVLLRRWRDEVAVQLDRVSKQRVESKERLRAALAGDDEPDTQNAKPRR
jgi:hypothetical protein